MSFDFSGTWVRATPTGLERLRGEYEHLAVDAGNGWYRINFGSASIGHNIPAGTIACSTTYGESVHLASMAIVNLFEIAHANAGSLVRQLTYVDGEWHIVEGTQQPWEPALLYPPDKLARWRDDPDLDPKHRDELDALERGAPIARRASFPIPSTERVVGQLARQFGFNLFP